MNSEYTRNHRWSRNVAKLRDRSQTRASRVNKVRRKARVKSEQCTRPSCLVGLERRDRRSITRDRERSLVVGKRYLVAGYGVGTAGIVWRSAMQRQLFLLAGQRQVRRWDLARNVVATARHGAVARHEQASGTRERRRQFALDCQCGAATATTCVRVAQNTTGKTDVYVLTRDHKMALLGDVLSGK